MIGLASYIVLLRSIKEGSYQARSPLHRNESELIPPGEAANNGETPEAQAEAEYKRVRLLILTCSTYQPHQPSRQTIQSNPCHNINGRMAGPNGCKESGPAQRLPVSFCRNAAPTLRPLKLASCKC